MQRVRVQVSPSYYQCEEGILDQLEELCTEVSINSVLIIHGVESWKATEPYFPTLQHVKAHYVLCEGFCSETNIAKLSSLVREHQVDAIIGIGGGTIMDITKAVAQRTYRDAILIPTLASTCAAWTPLSVIYDDEGRFTHFVTFLRSSLMVLVEPRIIAQSPMNYLRAGIADTLAKWYEAVALTKHLPSLRVPVQLALDTAKLCKDVLLTYGKEALQTVERKEVSYALLHVIEANILAGGMVGGLGEHYGRIAAAHSIHNALTQFAETHHLLHGEKVAYGILIQLALEEEFTEIENLLPYYREMQLPLSLIQVGLDRNDHVALEQLAVAALKPSESIHYMKRSFVPEDIITAIFAVEQYNK